MKKLVLLFAVVVASISVASAQERGQWTLGPKMNIYANSGDGAIFSLGAFARYNPTDAWRLEPAVSVLFHSGCSVDIGCDVHYLFEVAPKWYLYPLAGITVSDIGKWGFGMNLGAGTDFAIARNWDLTAAVKWMPVFESLRKNPIVISVGACYKF
ncbi:MAG: porin family protein [Rikenellaceae bacterium]|nr:porin family protein [Rikenellaceae bacterium]